VVIIRTPGDESTTVGAEVVHGGLQGAFSSVGCVTDDLKDVAKSTTLDLTDAHAGCLSPLHFTLTGSVQGVTIWTECHIASAIALSGVALWARSLAHSIRSWDPSLWALRYYFDLFLVSFFSAVVIFKWCTISPSSVWVGCITPNSSMFTWISTVAAV
jgi:hypothetical protein